MVPIRTVSIRTPPKCLVFLCATLVSLGILCSQTLAEPVPLPVKGFLPAMVVKPNSTERRPVIVGLHGNFDRPEWFCAAMETLVEGKAWLLCPRGFKRTDVPAEYDRYTFGARRLVLDEISAGLAALNQRFGERVEPQVHILAGFSLGAIYASHFAAADPSRYSRVYIVEGGHKVWTKSNIAKFARLGGRGIILGCGNRGCGRWSKKLCRQFSAVNVPCAEATAPALGHSYTDPLPSLIRPHWRKLFSLDKKIQ